MTNPPGCILPREGRACAGGSQRQGGACRRGIGTLDAGRSEQTLAAALGALGVKPGQVIVATIDRRLSCLAFYPIDLHQVHQPISLSPVTTQMRAMGRLLHAGKIRSVGVSNFSARRMEAAQRLGITIIAWSPLAQGLLTGRLHEEPGALGRISPMRRMMSGLNPAAIAGTAPLIEGMRAVARANGVSVAQVALHWTVNVHGETVVAIPGATKPSRARESAGAMGFRLSAAEIARIDELSKAAEAVPTG